MALDNETRELYISEFETRSLEPGFDHDQFDRDFQRGLNNSGRNRIQPESAKSLEGKGFFRETTEALIGGVADAGELWMRAVRAIDPEGGNDVIRNFATSGISAIQNFVSKHPSLSPDNQVQEGVGRWWVEGVRALVPSLSASIPGIIAGGVAGSLPGAAAGGAALSGAIFGLAEFDKFHEEVDEFIIENKLSEEEAANLRAEARGPAIFSALTEGGLEAAANALQIRTLGRFIPGRTALKNVATQPIRELFKKSGGQIAKETAKTLAITTPVEVGTEFAQAALETKFRRDIGLTNTDSIEAGFRAMGPAFVMNLLFFGAGRGTNAFQRHSIRKSLQKASIGENRKKAVKDIADIVRGTGDPNSEAIAATLEASGNRFVEEGIPVNLDTQVGMQHFFNEYLEGMQRGEITLKQSEKLVSKVQKDLESGQLTGRALIQAEQIVQGVSTINDRVKVQGILKPKEKRKKRPATAIEKLVGLADAAVTGKTGSDKDISTVEEVVEEKDTIKQKAEDLKDVADSVTEGEAAPIPTVETQVEEPTEEIEEAGPVIPEAIQEPTPFAKTSTEELVSELVELQDLETQTGESRARIAVLEKELVEERGQVLLEEEQARLPVEQLETINITERPVNKLEAPLENVVKEEAKLVEEEINKAVQGERIIKEGEVTAVPSTFPPYFAKLKGSKTAIRRALTKIKEGKGDTGIMVGRIKTLIQDRLQGKQSRFEPGTGQPTPERGNRFVEEGEGVVTPEGTVEAKPEPPLNPVDQAKKNITDKMGRPSVGVDPTIIKDMAIVGAHHFNSGLKTFKSWSGAMITDLGNSIKEFLRRIWRVVRGNVREGRAVIDESTTFQKQNVEAEQKQTSDKEAQKDQIDAVEKTTEFVKSEQADKQPDLLDQFNSFITHNDGNVLINNGSKEEIGDLFSDIKENGDITWLGRITNLPYQKAKKWIPWKRALGIEISRQQNKNLLMVELGRKVFGREEVTEGSKADKHEFVALNEESTTRVSAVVLEGDARRTEFTNKQLGEDGITINELSKITDEYQEFSGKPIKLTEEEITAYRAWQVTMKSVRRKLVEANENMLFKPFQGEKWFEQLKSVVKKNSSKAAPKQKELGLAGKEKIEPEVVSKLTATDLKGLNDAEQAAFTRAYNQIIAPHIGIQELRKQMGELKGYVPHLREEGTIKISFVDKDGQVQDSSILRNRKEAQAYATERTAFHKRKGNDYTLLKAKDIARTPEFLYQDVSVASLERFSNKAFDRFKLSKEGKKPGEITTEDLDGIREGMKQALADELSARGFGERTLRRTRETNIAGYRVTNLKDILHGYISGSSGFMTKMEAAYQQGVNLSEIDVSKQPNLYEEISIYGRNMMRNLTRADQVSSKIRTFAFMWYLSGQLKSPAVNFTQNYILGIPELAKFTSGAARKYHKAMLDISTGRLSDIEKKALLEAAKRGDTGDQLMQDIFGQTNLHTHKSLHKLIKILSFPFSASEVLNRKFAFLARFRAGIEKGETAKLASENATKFIFDVHFLYGKLNQPIISTGGTPFSNVIRTSLTFRMYTFSYMNAMKNHIGDRNFMLVGRSMAYLTLLGGLSALPFLDDFLDMWERFTGIPIRKKIQQELKGVGGDVLAVVGTQGLPSLLGVDLSGSLRIHLPDPTDPARLFEESVFGVYEGLAVKAKDSFQSLLDGEPLRALEQAAPIFVEKPLKAWRVSRDGKVTTKTGKTIFTDTGRALKLSGLEAVVQSLGFRPATLAFESGKFRQFTNVERNFQARRIDIFRRLRFAKTGEERRKVFKAIRVYNRDARKLRGAMPLITPETIRRSQKERPSKRFRAFSRAT